DHEPLQALMRRRVRAYLARFDPRLGPVVIIGFVAFTAYSAWWPFMVLWLTGPLGQSASVAGIVLVAGTVVGMVGSLLGGALSDRIGRRAVVIGALGVGAV